MSEASQMPRHSFNPIEDSSLLKKYQEEVNNSNRLKQKLEIAEKRLV
jgi:hypothetical protein